MSTITQNLVDSTSTPQENDANCFSLVDHILGSVIRKAGIRNFSSSLCSIVRNIILAVLEDILSKAVAISDHRYATVLTTDDVQHAMEVFAQNTISLQSPFFMIDVHNEDEDGESYYSNDNYDSDSSDEGSEFEDDNEDDDHDEGEECCNDFSDEIYESDQEDISPHNGTPNNEGSCNHNPTSCATVDNNKFSLLVRFVMQNMNRETMKVTKHAVLGLGIFLEKQLYLSFLCESDCILTKAGVPPLGMLNELYLHQTENSVDIVEEKVDSSAHPLKSSSTTELFTASKSALLCYERLQSDELVETLKELVTKLKAHTENGNNVKNNEEYSLMETTPNFAVTTVGTSEKESRGTDATLSQLTHTPSIQYNTLPGDYFTTVTTSDSSREHAFSLKKVALLRKDETDLTLSRSSSSATQAYGDSSIMVPLTEALASDRKVADCELAHPQTAYALCATADTLQSLASRLRASEVRAARLEQLLVLERAHRKAVTEAASYMQHTANQLKDLCADASSSSGKLSRLASAEVATPLLQELHGAASMSQPKTLTTVADASITSPGEFRMSRPVPTNVDFAERILGKGKSAAIDNQLSSSSNPIHGVKRPPAVLKSCSDMPVTLSNSSESLKYSKDRGLDYSSTNNMDNASMIGKGGKQIDNAVVLDKEHELKNSNVHRTAVVSTADMISSSKRQRTSLINSTPPVSAVKLETAALLAQATAPEKL